MKMPDIAEIRAVALERKIGPSASANTAKIVTKGRAQVTESGLESQFLVLKSFDLDVLRVQMQPVTLHWPDGKGGERKYTPDALVEYRSGAENPSLRNTELIEIKPAAIYLKNREELDEKFAVARIWAKHKGLNFLMVTENDIPPIQAWNIQFLTRYSNDKIMLASSDAQIRQKTLNELLRSVGETSPGELLVKATENSVERGHLLPLLWNLIYKRVVNVDIAAPLNMASRIWANDQNVRETHNP